MPRDDVELADQPRPPSRAGWAVLALLVLGLISIPFVLWEEAVFSASRAWLSRDDSAPWGMLVVVSLLGLDMLLPVPSSFVSAAAVVSLGSVRGAVAIWLGMSLAASLGYAIGRGGGVALARRLVGNPELGRARRLMNRYGDWVLLGCRGVPVLAEASTLLAGIARSSPTRFLLVTSLGNLGLALAYAATATFELQGASKWLTPFGFGVIVPGLLLLGARALARREGE